MTKYYFPSLNQEREVTPRKEQDSEDTYSTKSNYDMLYLLIRSRDEEGNGLSHKQIIDELNTVVFVGHDTTGSTSSFVFYHLAKYPELQEECREEVLSVMGGRDEIEWKDIGKFTYLACSIKETLRLYQPALFVSKKISGFT
ncbi:Cytochrome P450 4F6-like isoform X2 [Oopsacas minuta]|uniref:Cytochrome P450 4F6-like isoform X2 n=1 Tax=Oopsacas minuta TaxID=111878 RepID=A0AAV7K9V5_9METZ|nr:Cytochrome P450 4F6-like isoform X2 [Oopsacas minuta]